MRSIALAASALFAPSLFALAACSSEPDADEQLTTLPANGGVERAAPIPPSELVSPVETLAGEWRVAGIDGEPFNESYGLSLSADDGEIWWEPRCANLAFRYRIDGLRLATGDAAPPAPVTPGSSPPPVCTVGIPQRLHEVSRALDTAQWVGRTPSNGVLIEGGGHSLTLYGQ